MFKVKYLCHTLLNMFSGGYIGLVGYHTLVMGILLADRKPEKLVFWKNHETRKSKESEQHHDLKNRGNRWRAVGDSPFLTTRKYGNE